MQECLAEKRRFVARSCDGKRECNFAYIVVVTIHPLLPPVPLPFPIEELSMLCPPLIAKYMFTFWMHV